MAYIEVPDSDLDADSPWQQSVVQQMNDNIKSNRAGEVTNGNAHNHEGGDGAQIPQGGLKTTTSEVSTTSTTGVDLTLAGGEYGFYPQLKSANVAQVSYWGEGVVAYSAAQVTGTSYTTNIKLRTSSGTYAAYAQQRYIQASPPYDLGNGEIPLFIYAVINNATNKIEATYIAEDPPWAYNGKYRINPKMVYGKGDKRFLRRNIIPHSRKDALKDKTKLLENMQAIKKPKFEDVEITQELKNKGMIDVPHPFMGNDLIGKSIVLLDPCSDICGDLHSLSTTYDSGVSEVTEILLNDNIVLGNNQIDGLITPNGVMGVSMKWK